MISPHPSWRAMRGIYTKRKRTPASLKSKANREPLLRRKNSLEVTEQAMLLNNSCLAALKLFVVRISASWVIRRNLASHLPQSCLMLTLEGFPFITVNNKEYHSECSGNYHKDNV
ncbi:hypothetical protein Tco_1394137 [Tanacetum coccineum]